MSDARVGERPAGTDPGFERFLDGLIHSWTRTVAALWLANNRLWAQPRKYPTR